MGKYDAYTYKSALETLDDAYMNSSDGTNYADVLLQMNSCSNIDDCFHIYNRLLRKYNELGKRMYVMSKDFFDEYLNLCLNENLIRLLKVDSEINYKKDGHKSLVYLVNLRPANNYDDCLKEWKKYIKETGINDALEHFKEIKDAVKKYNSAAYEFKFTRYSQGTHGYNQLKDEWRKSIYLLIQYGYKTVLEERNPYRERNILLVIISVILLIILLCGLIFGWMNTLVYIVCLPFLFLFIKGWKYLAFFGLR